MKIVAIVVGGGPAPGINGVIAAVTQYSILRRGWQVVGILEGFKNLIKRGSENVACTTLTLENTDKIHLEGGSILKTSRVNPTTSEESIRNVVANLQALNIRYLVTIGGDDTAHSSNVIATAAGDFLRVIHVPKTIDNDLPLPGGHPTFGYTTAVHFGGQILKNILADARSVGRWYLAEAMGRKSGFLALGMSTAAGCQLCLIPEQFGNNEVTLKSICDCIETTMIKRQALGYTYGVVVLAEGLAERMSPTEQAMLFKGMTSIPVDDHGHIRLEKANLVETVASELEKRFTSYGMWNYGLTTKKIGYELRCQDPIAFDVQYTRMLGCSAMKLLDAGMSGVMVALSRDSNSIVPLSLNQLKDKSTGRIMTRVVDCSGRDYQVAREYMPHLTLDDFKEEAMLLKLSTLAKRTPDEFRRQFGHVPSLFPIYDLSFADD